MMTIGAFPRCAAVQWHVGAFVLALLAAALLAPVRAAEPPGTEEFGLTPRQLVQAIEKVEAEIEKCMRAQGFQYFAVDYDTVRKGMNSDKRLPGMSESEFIEKFGYGISTFYTGQPPQLENGYSPGRVGLGERNVSIYKALSAADQVAYNRALWGRDTEATFAVALERENFSNTGGCTRKAVERVFTAKQMEASYYNPKDDLINKDPRMKAALRKYAIEMRKAGFDYAHPDDVAPDILKRLLALTQDRTLAPDKMTPNQLKALKSLQDFERRVGKKNFELRENLLDPVEAQIEKELYARAVQ
jgi:hypothetical protein